MEWRDLVVMVEGHKRKQTSRKRESWENLPVLVIDTIEPKDIELSRYRRIGEETSYTVEFQPGMLYRRAIVMPKFGILFTKNIGFIFSDFLRFKITDFR